MLSTYVTFSLTLACCGNDVGKRTLPFESAVVANDCDCSADRGRKIRGLIKAGMDESQVQSICDPCQPIMLTFGMGEHYIYPDYKFVVYFDLNLRVSCVVPFQKPTWQDRLRDVVDGYKREGLKLLEILDDLWGE